MFTRAKATTLGDGYGRGLSRENSPSSFEALATM